MSIEEQREKFNRIVGRLFIYNSEGQEFLEMADGMLSVGLQYPAHPTTLAQYGGAECYLAYERGLKSFLHILKKYVTDLHNQLEVEKESATTSQLKMELDT